MRLILITLLITSLILPQTDKMYIGENKAPAGKKIKTIEKTYLFGNDITIYGKYNGVNWETGEIDFMGNDGRLYSDPTFVQAIKTSAGEDYLKSPILQSLKGKKRETAIANLKAGCEKNSAVKVMVLPFKNDFYGLTEDVEKAMSVEGCFDVSPNEKGLMAIMKSNLDLEKLNDFTLLNIGKEVGVDYIIYGYASEYDVPYKYAAANTNQSIQRVSIYDSNNWLDDLLISLNNWAVESSEMSLRSAAQLAAGSYISLTYFSINTNDGQKEFLTKNKTVLKKG